MTLHSTHIVAALLLAGALGATAGVLSVPESYTPDKAWPVIVSLQDNPDPTLTSKSPCFLVHAGGKGVECSTKIHDYLKQLVGKYNIDLRRIYGTGFSRGGHELLEQTWHYPHLFAASAPVCNDLRTEPKVFFAKYVRNTPTLLLHGDHDMFVKTGQRVHELMQAASCPVEWGTYPGGHSPETPFKKDLTLLTKFFEKHTFDPYPRSVTHVVLHPRYARAFWIDCYLVTDFLETRAPQPVELPATNATPNVAAQKPYGARSAVFTVSAGEGNRIGVEANEDVAALDLYLTDRLVDMTRPVKVVAGDKTLYDGAAACPLKITLKSGGELKAAHLKPLWEELTEIQRKAQYKPLPPKEVAKE